MYFNIAQLTCDLDSRRILSTIDRKPRSAKEIAQTCHMSISRCYRMIKEMESLRMLRRADVDGREISYISNLRSIELSLIGDHITLVVVYRDGTRTEMRLGPEDLERTSSISQDLVKVEPSTAPSTAA
jgi:AraC-like DNA-binding protein